METISSTEFRKTYHTLGRRIVVTVNGHPIGTWDPEVNAIVNLPPNDEPLRLYREDVEKNGPMFPEPDEPMRRAWSRSTPVPKHRK